MAARSARRYKYKFKWTKELSFLLGGILVLIVATILLALPTKVERLIAKWSDSELTTETVFVEISESRLASLIESGEYIFVYYATPDQSDATTYIDLIEEKATLYEVETVYWLDSTEIYEEDEDTLETRDFKEEVQERGEALGGVDLLETLSFWVFNEGELILDFADYSDSDSSNVFEQVICQAFGAYRQLLEDNKSN